MKKPSTTTCHPTVQPKQFTTIEVDLTQPGGWRLLSEPRRIIACLKACEGISTDDLERQPAWTLMDLLKVKA